MSRDGEKSSFDGKLRLSAQSTKARYGGSKGVVVRLRCGEGEIRVESAFDVCRNSGHVKPRPRDIEPRQLAGASRGDKCGQTEP